MFRSWKPVVQTDDTGKWYENGLRFATQDEAKASARDLAARWMLVRAHSAMPDEAEPNYRYAAGQLEALS
jgi:hypothetical protein